MDFLSARHNGRRSFRITAGWSAAPFASSTATTTCSATDGRAEVARPHSATSRYGNSNTGAILLTGDLYHYPAERALNKFRAEDNIEQTRASRIAIEELLRRTGAQLWIQHDILTNATLKKAPQFYD